MNVTCTAYTPAHAYSWVIEHASKKNMLLKVGESVMVGWRMEEEAFAFVNHA